MTNITLIRRQLNAVLLNATRESLKGEELRTADPPDLASITASLAKLNSYQSRIFEYSEIILDSLTDDASVDTEIAKIETAKDNLLEIVAKLDATLQKLNRDEIQSAAPVTSGGSINGDGRDVSGYVSVKLPKLQMPKFSGDPMKFQEFWDTFDTTIHQHARLATVEKFKYLRSYLDGSALVLAEGYSLTSVNYGAVIAVLKERFGDPELAIFCHLDALLAVPMAGIRAHELQRVYDECECHIRSLVALGLEESKFGRVFVPILLSKLPAPVRVTLHQKKGSGVGWTLAELREMIRTEIYAREMGARSFGNKKEPDHQKPRGAFEGHRFQKTSTGSAGPPTASALSTSYQREKGVRCNFCGGTHYSDQCRKHFDLEARRKALGNSCYICLKEGHSAANCKGKRSCFFCQRDSHHRSLCPRRFGKNKDGKHVSSVDSKVVASGSQAISDVNATIVTRGKRGVLQTALADVRGTKGIMRARLLLDIGSDNSFATNAFLKQTEAQKKGVDVIGLAGFKESKRSVTSSPVHEISITLTGGKQLLLNVYGTDIITCPIDKQPLDVHRHPILSQLPLAEPLSDNEIAAEIDILIGSDYYYDIVNTERVTLGGGLLLLGSELGYIVAGCQESDTADSTTMVASLARKTLPDSNFDLERFWRLEDIGIKDPPETCEDEIAIEKFNGTVRFDNDEARYEVKWPWKETAPDLPDNFMLSFGRLKSQMKRLQVNKQVCEKYQQTIDDQLIKGVIEEVPDKPDGAVVHYIPHHGVITPQKSTTNLRIVYDASCKIRKEVASLNNSMYRGPVLLQDLCGLLLRFRLNPVAVVSDLEKAFLQIGLQKSDRDAVRFLWLRNSEKPCTLANLIHYRFRRVCFGVISSPFLLAATIAHHLNREGSSIALHISENIYVDNIVDGVNSTNEALVYYDEAKRIFRKASMNLREFFSNDAEFIAKIPDSDRGTGVTTKVLGLTWNIKNDSLSIPVGNASAGCNGNLTKRRILRSIAQIFDPCGFFAPITSVGKMIMQELWQDKYDWDTVLPAGIAKQWEKFQYSYRQIPNYEIPRYYGISASLKADRADLHCFCDASAKVFCAVAYVTVLTDAGVVANLCFSKSRVSPLKKQTIPRLELLAIFIGAKLLDFVESQLRIKVARKILWSDSQCALQWVMKDSVSTLFVNNRVKKIRESHNIEFRYVPTDENPADLPTRGQSFDELSRCQIWWHGPRWIRGPESEWPTVPRFQSVSHLVVPEATTALSAAPNPISVFEVTRASCLDKLVLTVVYVRRFITQARKLSQLPQLAPSVDEMNKARLLLITEAQNRHFHNLFSSKFKSDKNFISQLGLFLDPNSIIRCSGRLQRSTLPDAAKNPILLPKGDPFTALVVNDCHSRLHHAGVKHTLAETRYQFWVVKGRSDIRRIISRCNICRWLKGGHFTVPREPPLPKFRIQGGRPFACVGIDYLGPLLVYPAAGEQQKAWICLFTCAATRALHLEVISSMSSEDFLMAFRRFIAVCGCPDMVISDNAKTFVASEKAIGKLWKEILEQADVQMFSVIKGIRWKFIVEMAPWMGGFYERMVGIVKGSLKSALHRKKLDITQLQTVVPEITTVVNSRPLIYSENEVGDHPLTPAHLTLRHHSLLPFPRSEEEVDHIEKPNAVEKLIRGWKRLQRMVDCFWHNWQHQYIIGLRERCHQLKQSNSSSIEPSVGMAVLLGERTLPRGRWKLGRVVEMRKSSDGLVRSAIVKTSEGKILNRPLKLLYPLETEHFSIDGKVPSRTEGIGEGSGFSEKARTNSSLSTADNSTEHPSRLESAEKAQLLRSAHSVKIPARSRRKAAVDASAKVADCVRALADDSE